MRKRRKKKSRRESEQKRRRRGKWRKMQRRKKKRRRKRRRRKKACMEVEMSRFSRLCQQTREHKKKKKASVRQWANDTHNTGDNEEKDDGETDRRRIRFNPFYGSKTKRGRGLEERED